MKLIQIFLFSLFVTSVFADWPQWRGPQRNGIAVDAKLPDTWDKDFVPRVLWESNTIPSDHYGGHGSAVVADGKVFLSVVWHRDEPTPTRTLDNRSIGNLNYRTNDFSPELMDKFEKARLGLSPRLRGNSLKEWAENWADENLNEKQLLTLKSWVVSRFKQGNTAVPWADFEIIKTIIKREFESAEALETWVTEQKWTDPATAQKLIEAIPHTKMAADDVIVCLDLETGETLWKFQVPGAATGRSSSSTPAVVDGIVYGLLSKTLYAVSAETGEKKWSTELGSKRALACSPLVAEGKVVIQTGKLVAFSAETGEKLWENGDVKTTNSSPALWKDVVICNSSKELVGVHLETGETKWRQPAGGDGTPVVNGDSLVVTSKSDGRGISAYSLSVEGARELWSKDFLARRYGSSPIIHNGSVFHLGSARHMCLDLESGETKWEVERSSQLSSPVLANDKLLVFENNGGYLAMIGANSDEHEIQGRVKVSALGCTSPALIGSKAVLRMRDKVICVDLEPSTP